MIEVLPIRILRDEDSLIFGSLNVSLGKLSRLGLPVAPGIVVTPPGFKLKTTLERFDFGKREVFEQSLSLVKKEINKISVPEILIRELSSHKQFSWSGKTVSSVKNLWLAFLDSWLDQIKDRLWNSGFFAGITENLDPKTLIFTRKVEGSGKAYFDPLQDEVEVKAKSGSLHPADLKKIVGIVKLANKILFIPHEYGWIIDRGVKLTGVMSYTPLVPVFSKPIVAASQGVALEAKGKSAVKVFFDLSGGLTIEKDVDGVYIASEKIFDLNKPQESFDNLVFKVVESAITFPNTPVFLKLADKSEGMGKLRGALRLIHQKSLLDPLLQVLDFARHKKGLTNIHIVIPFVRGVSELLQIKRELATKKLMRKASLQYWMEVAIPENIINLENYLMAGIDGIVLNLDELIAHLNGFDPLEGELAFYKNEVDGLIKFLEDGIRLLHKSKTPFIAYGSLTLYPKVLEFLVEKGVYGVVVERFEAHSAHDLLHQMERRVVLRKTGS